MKRTFFRNQRGQAMVELALVLPVLLVLFMGVVEFGRIFHSYLIITNASREGARVAIVGKSDIKITERISEAAAGLDITKLEISIDPDSETRKTGDLATVQVSYSLDLAFPLFGTLIADPLIITSQTKMRME